MLKELASLKWDSSKSAAQAFCSIISLAFAFGFEGEAYHVESTSSRNNSILIFDILDTSSWQANRDDGEKTQDFSHESSHVGYLFFDDAFLPGVAVGVDFHDFVVGALLDFLAVLGGEVGDAHDEVSGDGVETGGDHG